MVTTITRTITGTVVVSTNCDERNFYVDATLGDNSYDGRTPETAWKTVAKVNAETFVAGDNILFKCGETFAGRLAPTDSGEDFNPIFYGSYDTGARPIISGVGLANSLAVLDNSYHNYVFSGLDFSGATGASNGTVQYNSHDAYFYDCIMRDSANRGGVGVYSTTGVDLYNVTFDTCEFKDNYTNGLFMGSQDHSEGPHDCLITHCTAHNNGHSAYADHGIYVNCGVIIEYCTAYSNSSAGFKLNDEYIEGPYYPILRYCISYNNYDGICAAHYNAIYHHNVVYDNTSSSIIFDYSEDSLFYFNTLVNAGGNGLQWTTGCVGNTFRNNVIVQDEDEGTGTILECNTSLATMLANNSFQYNEYYHTDTNPTAATLFIFTDGSKTWSDWQTGGAEKSGGVDTGHLLTAEPQFVTPYSDLHPANGGNLDIHHGIAIVGYETDFDGHTHADPPNCGAYEESAA